MENKISKLITKILSWIQFRIDTTKYFIEKPRFDYQPMPWVGITEASIRGNATIQRWDMIKKHISSSDKTLKDIGSCAGYFCISASEELGMTSLGIDINDRFLRLSRYALPKKIDQKCNFIKLNIDKKTVKYLPSTDITLCLSVWHHWVFSYGLEDSTMILRSLWNLTNCIMFFESGEEEIREEFNMPFSRNQKVKDWLYNYLDRSLENAIVESAGSFEAGNYPHYKIKNFKRTVFKIIRK